MKFHLKLYETAFSTVLRDDFRPEVGSDVISGAVVEPTGVKISVKHSDSRSNRSRDIRLPHFVTNDDDDVRQSSHKGKTL